MKTRRRHSGSFINFTHHELPAFSKKAYDDIAAIRLRMRWAPDQVPVAEVEDYLRRQPTHGSDHHLWHTQRAATLVRDAEGRWQAAHAELPAHARPAFHGITLLDDYIEQLATHFAKDLKHEAYQTILHLDQGDKNPRMHLDTMRAAEPHVTHLFTRPQLAARVLRTLHPHIRTFLLPHYVHLSPEQRYDQLDDLIARAQALHDNMQPEDIEQLVLSTAPSRSQYAPHSHTALCASPTPSATPTTGAASRNAGSTNASHKHPRLYCKLHGWTQSHDTEGCRTLAMQAVVAAMTDSERQRIVDALATQLSVHASSASAVAAVDKRAASSYAMQPDAAAASKQIYALGRSVRKFVGRRVYAAAVTAAEAAAAHQQSVRPRSAHSSVQEADVFSTGPRHAFVTLLHST